MSVKVYPAGGLGNQLFIYATGLATARRLGVDLQVDPIHLTLDPLRKLELDSFRSYYKLVDRSGRLLPLRLTQQALNIRFGPFNNQLLEQSLPGSRHVGRWGGSPRSRHLWGYFQSWAYFDDIATTLRDDLRLIVNKSDDFMSLSRQIQDSEVPIGVHVRRGDFAENSPHGRLPDSYFEAALTLVTGSKPASDVFVFSDDIPSLRAASFLGARPERIHFLDQKNKLRPIEIVNLLAQCERIVMSNSSLSWWGAWLGASKSQTAIYPRPWLPVGSAAVEGFALTHWQSLGWRLS